MNKILIVLALSFFVIKTSSAQKLLYIGEKSYVCTNTFELQSKTLDYDVDVFIAKDGSKGLFVVSIVSSVHERVLVNGKFIIYLDDGTLISCIDRDKYDYVDNVGTTFYYITTDEPKKRPKVPLSSKPQIISESFLG